MDAKNAFLHGELQENVYMILPPGYLGEGHRLEVQREGVCVPNMGSSKVCKLNKSLYGLKQAPRQWFAKLNNALKSHGFVQSKSDYTLFSKEDAKRFLVILVYVDDLILASNCSAAISHTKEFLNLSLHMKDMGILRYFLGIQVDHCNQGLFLSQKKYVQDLLTEYGMDNSKPVKLPMDNHTKLSSHTGTPLSHFEPYQKLVGKLIYPPYKARHHLLQSMS